MDVIDESVRDVMKYYHTGADGPVCHSLTQLRDMECDARCIHDLVDSWIAEVPDDKDPLWMVGSLYNIILTLWRFSFMYMFEG